MGEVHELFGISILEHAVAQSSRELLEHRVFSAESRECLQDVAVELLLLPDRVFTVQLGRRHTSVQLIELWWEV